MKASWLLPNLAATEALGRALAQTCPWGVQALMLYLSGELGAGKTTLAAAAIQSLGIKEAVRSPSYALIEVYQGNEWQVVHVDLYRLQAGAELEQLGLRDYFVARTLFLVEWPERASGALPRPDVDIRLEVDPQRQAAAQARSHLGQQWLAATQLMLTTDADYSDPKLD
jgi:tRNA threonylcarbamoyladenosine biosynthesis protein TsaE